MADVLAFPSKVDTFGLVIIEAMSLGTPVAAYPVPGPIDIIEPETGTMHDDLELAIERCLYLNRGLVQEKSKKWDWENCWKTFKNNLVEIV
jgi:glycosyltransferase involved in cell wall biosynthesis